MLIELTKLEKLQVGAMDEGTAVGTLKRVVVNPEDLKVIGFTVKIGAVFPKIKAVSFFDVVDIDINGLAINSRESLSDAKEIVRLNELMKKKYSIVGQPVRSKSGKKLGRVTDALVETTTGDILRIYTKYFISNYVFERSQIDKVTLREVIIKESVLKGLKFSKKVTSAEKVPELA